jgi:hypothetical protein
LEYLIFLPNGCNSYKLDATSYLWAKCAQP